MPSHHAIPPDRPRSSCRDAATWLRYETHPLASTHVCIPTWLPSPVLSALLPATYVLGSTAKMLVWPAESLSVKPSACSRGRRSQSGWSKLPAGGWEELPAERRPPVPAAAARRHPAPLSAQRMLLWPAGSMRSSSHRALVAAEVQALLLVLRLGTHHLQAARGAALLLRGGKGRGAGGLRAAGR